MRTQVRWGLADFEHRFGRPAAGHVAARDGGERRRAGGPGRGGRRLHDPGAEPGRHAGRGRAGPTGGSTPAGAGAIALVFYDGALSHDIAFGIGSQPAAALVARAEAAAGDGLVVVATDGETFGHHHRYAERAVAYALAVEAPRRGRGHRSDRRAGWRRTRRQTRRRRARERVVVRPRRRPLEGGLRLLVSGGRPGWNQAWRAPLRAALDLLRDHAAAVFEDRGGAVLRDPWAARDAYIERACSTRRRTDAFVARHVRRRRDRALALTLLEAAAPRHADVHELRLVLRRHRRARGGPGAALRGAVHGPAPRGRATSRPRRPSSTCSTAPSATTRPRAPGARCGPATCVPARVLPARVVAHIALLELLDGLAPQPVTAGFDVVVADHDLAERGSLGPRQRARGARPPAHRRRPPLRVRRACTSAPSRSSAPAGRPATPGPTGAALAELRAAFAKGTRLTQLLRLVTDRFGPTSSTSRPPCPTRPTACSTPRPERWPTASAPSWTGSSPTTGTCSPR